MVAAWIRALTGVGPSIASGSQTCSGNCADLPTAPQKTSNPAAVAIEPNSAGFRFNWSSMREKLSPPANPQTIRMPSRKPKSPRRLGVNVDRAADASDHKQHQQAEGIEPQAEVHLQFVHFKPSQKCFPPLWLPSVRRDKEDAQYESGNNCANGKLGAQLPVLLGEERDRRCREQRQEQDEP